MAGMTPLVNHRLLQHVGNSVAHTRRRQLGTGDLASLEEICLFVASLVAFGDEFDVDPTVTPQTRDLTSELTAPLGITVRPTTRPAPHEIAQDTAVGGLLLLDPNAVANGGTRLVQLGDAHRTIDANQDQLLSSHSQLLEIFSAKQASGEHHSAWLTDSWTDRYWGNKLLSALAEVPSSETGEPPIDEYRREFQGRVDAGDRASAFWLTASFVTQMRMGYLGAAAQRSGGIYLASGPVDQTAGRVAAYDDVLRRLLQSRSVTLDDDPGSMADLILNHALAAAALRPILDDRFRPEQPLTLLETARQHRTPALSKAIRQAMAASQNGTHDSSWVDEFVRDTERYVHRDHGRRDRLVRMIGGFLTAGGGLGLFSPWLSALGIGAGVIELSNASYEAHLHRTPEAAVATLVTDTVEPQQLARAKAKLAQLDLRR